MKFGRTLCVLVAAAAIGLSCSKKEDIKFEQDAIPQKEIKYVSVDDLIKQYDKAIENADYQGESARWFNIAMRTAKRGETWNEVEVGIKIAKKEKGYNNNDSSEAEEILRRVYDICIKTQNSKNADMWLNTAMKIAKRGEKWTDVEINVKIAEDYAAKASIELDKDRIREIKEAYKIGINEFGPQNAARWLRIAADRVEARTSYKDIKICLDIAEGYAKEAGID